MIFVVVSAFALGFAVGQLMAENALEREIERRTVSLSRLQEIITRT